MLIDNKEAEEQKIVSQCLETWNLFPLQSLLVTLTRSLQFQVFAVAWPFEATLCGLFISLAAGGSGCFIFIIWLKTQQFD